MQTIAEIISRLNLSRAGRWHRGVCPNCGKNSLSVAEGRARIAAICYYGCDRDALREALGVGKLPPADPATRAERDAKRLSASLAAARIWGGSVAVTHDDPAGRYLTRRGLASAIGNDRLRYRPDAPHPEGGKYPALILRVDGLAGELAAIHRIYLTRDGEKAAATPVKAAKGPIWGGAIRFGIGPAIVVAEGPETALAAGRLLGLPAWSAISAGNMATGLMLPTDLMVVTIAADHDAPGLAAAETAARRWRAEERSVRIITPNHPGTDFNDVLQTRLAGRGA